LRARDPWRGGHRQDGAARGSDPIGALGTIGLAILAVLAVLGISYGVRRSGLRLKLERR
jgi:hypothetical protein